MIDWPADRHNKPPTVVDRQNKFEPTSRRARRNAKPLYLGHPEFRD
jgi:hypothetical protein